MIRVNCTFCHTLSEKEASHKGELIRIGIRNLVSLDPFLSQCRKLGESVETSLS